MPVKKELLFPVFLECCSFADDVFWENIFEDLAYGKTPYGTYISKGFLICSYKNKEFSYKIERKDIKTLYDDIYKLLTEKLGILSFKEKIKKKLEFHEIEKTIKKSREQWTGIRKKNIKDVMYEKFVLDMKHQYSLSMKQCKFLLSTILLSITFKIIGSKDIKYNGKIESIDGISFEQGNILFKRDFIFSDDENSTLEENNTEYDMLTDNWPKYLKTLEFS